ncbi:MAG: hypothetical protein IT410_01420 [Candidatus Doudnabacteria bacterium]|nr:hypothetical protein [Candidatus Doudnabacteria bacterium]
MLTRKITSLIAILALIGIMPNIANAQLSVNPAFDPNKLIDDRVFSDTKTFGGASGIQQFLESKNSILANTSSSFIAKLKEPTSSALKQGLEDPQPDLNRQRTAAELIWDAAQHSGMNPQAILVTLEKEQSLITGRKNVDEATLQKALDRALGFGCPDGGGCDNIFGGFYYQLFGNFDAQANRYLGAAKSLMKSFSTPGGRGPAINNGVAAKVGETITLDNTLGGYEGVQARQTIVLSNAATAALYRYTPHVYNGNYNFWRFFNEWFRYPNNTIIKSGKKGGLFVILNGVKHPAPGFVLQARGLNPSAAITVSKTELESYTTGELLGPADNTVVKVDGESQLYVFISNIKHPASSFVIKQRGLNPDAALKMTEDEADQFKAGAALAPSPGTIVKGKNDTAVYLVATDGTLQLFTEFTFKQYDAAKKLLIVDDEELKSYEKKGTVPPLDGTIMKSTTSTTVYVLEGGLKKALTGEIFRNRGYSFANLANFSDEVINAYPDGGFAPPANGTWFSLEGKALYLFKDGERHYVSPFVAKQRGITPDYSFDVGLVAQWKDGYAIPPKDNTLIKSDVDGTVYVTLAGQLQALTLEAFKARGYSFKNVVVVPELDIKNMPKASPLLK